jgi:hypothetical protein
MISIAQPRGFRPEQADFGRADRLKSAEFGVFAGRQKL